jgi:hypothetical protein
MEKCVTMRHASLPSWPSSAGSGTLSFLHSVPGKSRILCAAVGERRRFRAHPIVLRGTGCFWGKADIKWQARPTDLVENDP